MPHFIAFYRCTICQKVIAGLVSDTMLIISGKDLQGLVVNPHQVKTDEKVETFCPTCAPRQASSINTNCYHCKNEIQLFYLPQEVRVVKPSGESILAITKTLLREHDMIAYCAVECYREHRKDRNKDLIIKPIFLEFNQNQ